MNRTWSGQEEKYAWHWNHETYKKLGNVLFLISKGTPEARTEAYHEYIEIKRWFMVEEFEEFIEKLDIFRVSKNCKPLRDIITEIYREMLPCTEYKAKYGRYYSDIMPDLELLIPREQQKPNGVLPKAKTENICKPEIKPEHVFKINRKLKVEQMSLFG